MLKFRTLPLLAVLAVPPALAANEPPPTPPPAVTADVPTAAGRGGRPFRVRVGAMAGLAMQKSQFELGGAWDFLKPHPMWRVTADLTVGLRPNEVSVVPMVGARFLVPVGKAPVEIAVGALVGANVTVMRGGTGVALPVRISMGGQYLFRDGLGVGLELNADFGPLVVPFSAPYAALHVTALFAWGL